MENPYKIKNRRVSLLLSLLGLPIKFMHLQKCLTFRMPIKSRGTFFAYSVSPPVPATQVLATPRPPCSCPLKEGLFTKKRPRIVRGRFVFLKMPRTVPRKSERGGLKFNKQTQKHSQRIFVVNVFEHQRLIEEGNDALGGNEGENRQNRADDKRGF